MNTRVLHCSLVSTDHKDIDFRFEALPQTHIHRPDLKPATWPLVEVQAPAYLDDPAVVEPDFSIVQVGIYVNLKLHVLLQQTLAQLIQLVVHVGQGRCVIEAGEQGDFPHRPSLQDRLTEPNKVLDLMG
jgi:hypothetical protein